MPSNAYQVRMQLKMRRMAEMHPDGTFPAFVEPKTEMGFPAAIQASYSKTLVDAMQPLNRAFFPFVKLRLNSWISETAGNHRQDSENIRLDGFFLDLSTIKETLMAMLDGMFGPQSSLTAAIFGTARKANKFNKNRAQKMIENTIRGSYYPHEPWVDEAIQAWATANLDLVKSLSQEYIVKMNETVQSAVTQGKTYQEVTDDLLKMGQNLTVSRARLIAVDQLGKLHGHLTKGRYQDAGLDLYEWRCSQDERVRGNPRGRYPSALPSHWKAHGMVCQWSNDSTYRPTGTRTFVPRPSDVPSAIPGYPIRCRCHAKPLWADLVGSVDDEIRSEMKKAA